MATKEELELELMTTQIENSKAETARLRQEMWWEPWKVIATLLVGVAAMAGVILTVAHFLPTPSSQPIIIQLPASK